MGLHGGSVSSVAVSTFAKTPLVVDGQRLRKGTDGPYCKLIGYNAHIAKNTYISAQTLDTDAKISDFLAQNRSDGNALVRVRIYAPAVATGLTWAQAATGYLNFCKMAAAAGVQVLVTLTTWGATDTTADLFTMWTQSRIQTQDYLHSVHGANSFEDWVKYIIPILAPYIHMVDVCNEPQDGGHAFTNDLKVWAETVRGWVRAIDSTLLTFIGIDLVGSVGGQAYHQTICTNMDLIDWHDYQSLGFVNLSQGCPTTANNLGKPLIIAETGAWTKAYYGNTGTSMPITDSDTDDSGWPAVDGVAQSKLLERKMMAALSEPIICGVLIYSYFPAGSDTRTTGHYEPSGGSPIRRIVREIPMTGDDFSINTLANISASSYWLDGAQCFRYAPSAPIVEFDWRHSVNNIDPASNQPLAARFGEHAGFQFGAGRYLDCSGWALGSSAQTHLLTFVPQLLPNAGSFSYLVGPASNVATATVRINSLGQIEIVLYAISTPAGGTIEGTSTNVVNVGAINTLSIQWSRTTGALSIILNGIRTTFAGKNPTFTASNARLGAAFDGSNVFQGIILEGIARQQVETDDSVVRVLDYFGRRYLYDAAPLCAPVGSVIESYAGSNVSLLTNVNTNIVSVVLTAGTWLITARATIENQSPTPVDAWIGPTSASVTGAYAGTTVGDSAALTNNESEVVITKVVTLTASTTVYFVANSAGQNSSALAATFSKAIPNATGITAVKIA